MKKKRSSPFAKIGLMAALAFSSTLGLAPASYGFETDDQNPPIQDGSKEKPKQGPKKEEEPKPPGDSSQSTTLIILIVWLLGFNA